MDSAQSPGVFSPSTDYVDIMRKLLVFLVVLALLLVGADTAARAVSQKTVAKQLSPVAGLNEEPQVSVYGFPFLTQVVSGHYQHLTLTAAHVPLDEDLTADEVTADVRNVTLLMSDLSRLEDASVTAGSVEVAVHLRYNTLLTAMTKQVDTDRMSFDITYVDAKTVHVSASTEVMGTTVTGDTDATVRLEGQKLVIEFIDDLFGDAPAAVASRIVAISLIAFPLDLPYGLAANGLTVTTNGVTITAEGSQVSLRNP